MGLRAQNITRIHILLLRLHTLRRTPVLAVRVAIAITERLTNGDVIEGELTRKIVHKLLAILEVFLRVVLADHSVRQNAAHRHIGRGCLRRKHDRATSDVLEPVGTGHTSERVVNL